jgi:parallel beta-helix repeat protein
MKKIILFLLCISLSFPVISYCQMYMNLADNLNISSNSWIIFNPGNYTLQDPGNDGLIRIDGKDHIILDGTGVYVDGVTYSGYIVKINNSHNITIRNFASGSHFNYAVYITNSDSIRIYNCNFSYNKIDSLGWIDVWTDYQSALGGGVMMYQTTNSQVYDNVMNSQNDGVAVYHCEGINIWNNDFAWNTSYGIRMYFTNSCHIHHNVSPHVNRPFTNPSDCAALLMIVSNENLVEYNDLSYSGDGVFLGQYEYSSIPNNNIFLYNECSYSPHNAIEATFADGNYYKGNICNYSHYGMWLGYSYNSLVDSNQIIGNQNCGIAIDRGFSNTITRNVINENPIGVSLWEGGNIPPYQNQFSHDYIIDSNTFEGNKIAVESANTEHLTMQGNEIRYNNDGIQLQGSSTQDTITSNNFRNTTFYHIENQSPADISAENNTFFGPDETFIACNIYDQADNAGKGEVIWHPFTYGNTPVYDNTLKEDMTEEPAVWYAYPDVCDAYDSSIATIVEWDHLNKKVGDASLFCWTGNGWDIGLEYWPAGDTIASWSLTDQDTLIFWLKTYNNNQSYFQAYHVRVGNYCGGYFKYSSSASVLTGANGQWKLIKIPLAGGGNPYYVRTQVGTISLDEINYVEVHADTYGVGFQIWLDWMHFSSVYSGVGEIQDNVIALNVYPNPFMNFTTVSFNLVQEGPVSFQLQDFTGRTVRTYEAGIRPAGESNLVIRTGDLGQGIYLLRMLAGGRILTKKIVLVNH